MNDASTAAPGSPRNDLQVIDSSHGGMQAAPEFGQINVKAVLSRASQLEEIVRQLMKPGIHYGITPGTEKMKDGKPDPNQLPSLLKPGAEVLCSAFCLRPVWDITKTRDGSHLSVEVICRLVHMGSGLEVGEGRGACSTLESKYRWRGGGRKCPDCGADAIKRSGYPDRDTGRRGWYCAEKLGGCNGKFREDDEQIATQETGRIENPDIADSYHAVEQIAMKRALVSTTRVVTGCSGMFGERGGDDHEDGHDGDDAAPATSRGGTGKPKAAAAAAKNMKPQSRSGQSPEGSKAKLEKGPEDWFHVAVVSVEDRKSQPQADGKIIPYCAIRLKPADGDAPEFEAIAFPPTVCGFARAMVGKGELAALIQDCRQGDRAWKALLDLQPVAEPKGADALG